VHGAIGKRGTQRRVGKNAPNPCLDCFIRICDLQQRTGIGSAVEVAVDGG
jgi:hypothetical protein